MSHSLTRMHWHLHPDIFGGHLTVGEVEWGKVVCGVRLGALWRILEAWLPILYHPCVAACPWWGIDAFIVAAQYISYRPWPPPWVASFILPLLSPLQSIPTRPSSIFPLLGFHLIWFIHLLLLQLIQILLSLFLSFLFCNFNGTGCLVLFLPLAIDL